MKLLLFACAQNCVVDDRSARQSLFNIYEEMTVRAFPAEVAFCDVVSLWGREPQDSSQVDGRLRVRLNTTQLVDFPFTIQFQDKSRCRVITGVHGLVLSGPGDLVFEAFVGDRLAGSWRVVVKSAEQAIPHV